MAACALGRVCVTGARGQSAPLPARLGASCSSCPSGTSFCRHRLRMLDRHASAAAAAAAALLLLSPSLSPLLHTLGSVSISISIPPNSSAVSLFAPPPGLRLP
jgi:hypothetical protein